MCVVMLELITDQTGSQLKPYIVYIMFQFNSTLMSDV